jgi:hypothetical protein
MTLPLVKHGIPARAVKLDNVLRFPGYLDRYKILLLSYEFQKPLHPGIHAVLADWVARGGTLVYIGAETDPFHKAKDWWNTAPQDFGSPSEHLMGLLGQDKSPGDGKYDFGKGKLVVVRKHPAYFSRSKENADELRTLIRECVKDHGEELIERNYFLLRRGPYVIAATMDESVSDEPLVLGGRFVNLLAAGLPIEAEISLAPGTHGWYLDLDKVTAKAPAVLASAGRIEQWNAEANSISYTTSAPLGVQVYTRILLAAQPQKVLFDGAELPNTEYQWDADSSTLLLKHPGSPNDSSVRIEW